MILTKDAQFDLQMALAGRLAQNFYNFQLAVSNNVSADKNADILAACHNNKVVAVIYRPKSVAIAQVKSLLWVDARKVVGGRG